MLVYYTDTDTDITPEIASEYGVKLISMPYIVGDKIIRPYVDFDKFDSISYYNMLRNGVIPTTGALNVQEYIDIFEKEFKEGNDIFYIHFSAAMTASFNNMKLALDELKDKYPERKFYEVDTKAITLGSYIIVKEIFDLIKENKTPEEILAWAEKEIDHYACFFYADDLKFFRRSGRVGGFAAFMGNMIGIKPIISITSAGVMESVGKEKGRQNALNRLLAYMDELGDNVTNYRICIGHTDYPELAEELKQKIISKYGKDLTIEEIVTNPTAGAHCGPDAVGIAFHAKHR